MFDKPRGVLKVRRWDGSCVSLSHPPPAAKPRAPRQIQHGSADSSGVIAAIRLHWISGSTAVNVFTVRVGLRCFSVCVQFERKWKVWRRPCRGYLRSCVCWPCWRLSVWNLPYPPVCKTHLFLSIIEYCRSSLKMQKAITLIVSVNVHKGTNTRTAADIYIE